MGKRGLKKGQKIKISVAEGRKRLERIKAVSAIVVNLKLSHTRNGKSFGPGSVRISRQLARELLSEEEHSGRMEEIFQGTRGMIAGPRGRTGAQTVKQVPIELFEDAVSRAPAARDGEWKEA